MYWGDTQYNALLSRCGMFVYKTKILYNFSSYIKEGIYETYK